MKITIIGAGNVGFHLSQRLVEVGHQVHQIFSRKTNKVLRIARIVNAIPIDNIASLNQISDLYIIAVKDDAIESVAEKMAKQISKYSRVVHTSGSVSSEVLAPYFSQYGVFYPLQTFSVNQMADFSNIPMLIDASTDKMKEEMLELAQTISPKCYLINDEQRAKIHVGAVMVNNFTNHLYAMVEDMMQKEELPMEVLVPLILEGAKKVAHFPAKEIQTGPAKRNDTDTIDKHRLFLEKYPNYKKVYEVLNNSILEMYKNKN